MSYGNGHPSHSATGPTIPAPSGTGSYQLSLPEGSYCVYCEVVGYHTEMWVAIMTSDMTMDFSLTPMDDFRRRIVDVSVDDPVIDHDGVSTTTGTIIVRDVKGQRHVNAPVSLVVDRGEIVSREETTDEMGRARFEVRSSTAAEVGMLVAASGTAEGVGLVYYTNEEEGEPILWPEQIMRDQVVSGDVWIRLYAADFSPPDEQAESFVEGQLMNMRGYVMKVDGQVFYRGSPLEDELPYPVVVGRLETQYYPNGAHTVTCEIEDSDGNIFRSAPYTLVSQNEMSELTIASNGEYADEVDLAAGDVFTISAQFDAEAHWRVCGYDLDTQSESGLGNEMVIAEGVSTDLTCQWDGRLPGYADDEDRNDLVFVEVQKDSDPSESSTWVPLKKRQVNVKPFPDSQVQVVLVQGWPAQKGPDDWRNDFVGVFPFRSECLYQRARQILGKTRRLTFTVATWPRVKSILTNGYCRMWYYMGHSRYQGFHTSPTETTYVTQIWLGNGLVFSKAVGDPPIGVGNLGELNMQHSTQLLFVMWDGCNTGQGGGTGLTNPPFVPANRRNEVAEALGMYSPTATGRVYIGWRGKVSNDNTTSNFVGAWDHTPPLTAPGAGMFDLWSRSTGRLLSYVIGNYPNAQTCPYILNSANQPESAWPAIWPNLRIYGSGDGVDNNLGMNLRMFSLTP